MGAVSGWNRSGRNRRRRPANDADEGRADVVGLHVIKRSAGLRRSQFDQERRAGRRVENRVGGRPKATPDQ